MIGELPVPALPLLLIIGYPVVTVVLFELARWLDHDAPLAGRVLRQVVTVLLPAGAIWLILTALAGLPPDNLAVRAALTVLALSGLSIFLRVAQAALVTVIGSQDSSPKLLFDILRITLALVWGAVVISVVWHVNLASLFAALGVGSIVLGFALQDVAGNLVSGLALLYDHKFEIGDWIVADGKTAQVEEMDWRSVTLVTATGDRIVIANSTLSKTNLTIAARREERSWIDLPLEFGLDIPPEQVRAAVLEAGCAVQGLAEGGVSVGGITDADTVRCLVTGYGETAIRYLVQLRLRDPSALFGPRTEFFSRLWYVAQRRGLRLGVPRVLPTHAGGPDEAERLHLLTGTGLFRGDAAMLAHLAAVARYQRWREGETLQEARSAADTAIVVLSGALCADMPDGRRLERVEPGQVFVLDEMLRGAASPVSLTADADTEVLAIPAPALARALGEHPGVARDLTALLQARRQALGVRRAA